MKSMGAVLVLLGTWGMGVSLCRERKRREHLLRDLIQGLTLMLGELQTHASPLGELLYHVSGNAGEASAFFLSVVRGMERLGDESFAEIWQREAEEKLSSLRPSWLDELRRLGVILGRVDLENEREALAACRNDLTTKLEAERAEALGLQRLRIGLWGCAGALLVILLC